MLEHLPASQASERVLRLREGLGLTQARLAELLGVSVASVIRWEHGRSQPSELAWQRILRAEDQGAIMPGPRDKRRRAAGAESPGPKADIASPRTNPPAPLTSFVGRETELSEIVRLLGTTRLLTLTGPGGCGKTRLALEVAREMAGRDLGVTDDPAAPSPSPSQGRGAQTAPSSGPSFAEGIWFVELAAIADGALIPQAIASAVGLRQQPGRPLRETLLAHLSRLRVLLVLDNCEHLVDAAASLVEALLCASPSLVILATSREPLRIGGEVTWSVPSLTLPDPGVAPSWGSFIESEAVQLFVERARAIQPGMRLTTENAAAIASLCRRLDGIPLALELAAACTRALTIQQITARLGDRFRLLSGGSRTAMPRQQTLRATIDWSYDLLTLPEQTLLRRLSVFPGSFALEAAESIGDTGSVPPGRAQPSSAVQPLVLDLLQRLTEKSLVLAEERRGSMRYRLLETMREYGRERLSEAGETELACERHAGYYLGVAEAAGPALHGSDASLDVCLDGLELDYDSLRHALTWLSANRRDESALRLAGALWRFWYFRGYIAEARDWLARLLVLRAPGAPFVRARALNGAGVLSWHAGDYAAARAYAEEGLLIQEEIGDRSGAAWSLNCLGLVALYEEDYERARSLLESTLVLQRELGDPIGIAGALLNLGAVTRDRGDYAAARPLIEEALSAFRSVPDRRGIAFCLHNLGLLLEARNPAASASMQQEGLRLRQELADPQGIFESLIGLAGLAAAVGNPERAVRLFAAVDALRRCDDLPVPPFYRRYLEQHLVALRAELSADGFSGAWEEGAAMGSDALLEQVREAGSGPAQLNVHLYPDHLTEREVEVLRLLACGRSNREIACDLVLSVHTVERHVANVYRKIGARGRANAASYAVGRGLVETT